MNDDKQTDHHYEGADGSEVRCACGHVESYENGTPDFFAACDRMNQHIRESLGEEKWNDHVKRSHMAVLDSTTGNLKKLTRD